MSVGEGQIRRIIASMWPPTGDAHVNDDDKTESLFLCYNSLRATKQEKRSSGATH